MQLPKRANNLGKVLGIIGLGAFTLLLAIFFGLIAGIGSIFLTIVFGTFFLGVTLFILAQFYSWSIPQLTLTAIIGFFFILEIVHKTIGLPLYGYWQLVVLSIGFLGLHGLWKVIVSSTLMKFSAVAFSLFLLVLIVSTVHTSRSSLNAAMFQFVSDLKFPMALAFGIYIGSKVNVPLAIERTIWVFIPVAFSALMLQWISPDAYLGIFPASSVPVETASVLPSPGLSIFNHPSILAAVSAMLAIYSFSKWKTDKARGGLNGFVFFALMFLLIASNQRQEIFAFILVITLIYIFIAKQGLFPRSLGAMVTGGMVFLLYLAAFGDMFAREASSWGISTVQGITHPRAELYGGAQLIAKAYFPFGSGLGTFGGVGSSKYDLSLPYELGFGSSWWWRDKDAYLLDTYWPNSVAESGAIGALFLLIHYLLFAGYLFHKAIRSQSHHVRMYWLAAGGSFLWVLFDTPTSPGFQEMRLIFFPALMFGMAVHADRKATRND